MNRSNIEIAPYNQFRQQQAIDIRGTNDNINYVLLGAND